jgi:hypothetical protein
MWSEPRVRPVMRRCVPHTRAAAVVIACCGVQGCASAGLRECGNFAARNCAPLSRRSPYWPPRSSRVRAPIWLTHSLAATAGTTLRGTTLSFEVHSGCCLDQWRGKQWALRSFGSADSAPAISTLLTPSHTETRGALGRMAQSAPVSCRGTSALVRCVSRPVIDHVVRAHRPRLRPRHGRSDAQSRLRHRWYLLPPASMTILQMSLARAAKTGAQRLALHGTHMPFHGNSHERSPFTDPLQTSGWAALKRSRETIRRAR